MDKMDGTKYLDILGDLAAVINTFDYVFLNDFNLAFHFA